MDGMKKSTVLVGGGRLHQRCADPINDELRAANAVDGGMTQWWITTFGTGVERKQFVRKFVSEQWILCCNSFERSLVYHL